MATSNRARAAVAAAAKKTTDNPATPDPAPAPTATGSSRLSLVRPAQRPIGHARAMITGPSGSGRTWTALSIARTLAGPDAPILVIDTERSSALQYAGAFEFAHLPWAAPWHPAELGSVLGEIGDSYAAVVVDSLTHFWSGQGGVHSLAESRGGSWATARQAHDVMINRIYEVPAHVILTARSETVHHLVEATGAVERVGLAPKQDKALIDELGVVLDLDMRHEMTVVKSRYPSVPVDRVYGPGEEKLAAAELAEWLAGGVELAPSEVVTEIVRRLNAGGAWAGGFIDRFGAPAALTVYAARDALAWIDEHEASDG